MVWQAAATGALSVAERSHPTSEVKGRGREYQTCELPRVQGQRGRLRGDTQRPRSGVAGRRSYPTPPRPRPGAASGRSNPMSKEPGLRGAQEGLEERSHVEGQEGQQ